MSSINSSLGKVFENPYVSGTVVMLLILYGSFAAPQLSSRASAFFDNVLVKLALFFAVAYLATQNTTIALTLVLVFFLTLYSLKNKRVQEVGAQIVSLRNQVFNGDRQLKHFETSERVTPNFPTIEPVVQDDMFADAQHTQVMKRMLPERDNSDGPQHLGYLNQGDEPLYATF
jgi:hypothetical protein